MERINENFEDVITMINNRKMENEIEQDSQKKLFLHFQNKIKEFPFSQTYSVSDKDLYELIHLLLENLKPKSIVNKSFLGKIMKKYSGTLSEKDSIIYEIFSLYEMKFDYHLYDFNYNWGNFDFDLKTEQQKWDSVKTLSYKFHNTSYYFPSHIKLYSKNENFDDKAIDIRFLLRWMSYLISKGNSFYYCVESGAFALILTCLSLEDLDMRKLADKVLLLCYDRMIYESAKVYPRESKPFHHIFFMIIRNSITEDYQRIPGYYNSYFSSIIPLIKDQKSIFYQKLLKFTCQRISFNFEEFIYTHEKSIEQSILQTYEDNNQIFYLSVLDQGLKSMDDAKFYMKEKIFLNLMHCYHRMKLKQKKKTLLIFSHLFQVDKSHFHTLIQQHLFLSFLKVVLHDIDNEKGSFEFILTLIQNLYSLKDNQFTCKMLEVESYHFFEILKSKEFYQFEEGIKLLFELYNYPSFKSSPFQSTEIERFIEKSSRKDLAIQMIFNIDLSQNQEIYNNFLTNAFKIASDSEDLLKSILNWVHDFNLFSKTNEANTKKMFQLFERVPYLNLENELKKLFKKNKKREIDEENKQKKKQKRE